MKSERFSIVQKMLWLVLTTVFLSVLFLSLFQLPVNTDMTEKMSGCPFMAHSEEVLCSMSAFDHITAWKSVFITIIPSFIVLLLALAIAGVVLTIAPHLLRWAGYRKHFLSREVRDRVYTFSYRPLQEFFSNGILHPKLF